MFAGEVGSPRLLKLFERHGIKTTWFIPGHSIETFPKEMAMVAEASHEIGLRGYSHENPVAMTLLRVIAAPMHGPDAERCLERAARSLQATGVRCTWRVDQGQPAERIWAVAGRSKLVVMSTRGHGAVRRWPRGSVADRVARDGGLDVLLARAGAVSDRDVGVGDHADDAALLHDAALVHSAAPTRGRGDPARRAAGVSPSRRGRGAGRGG